MAGTAQMQERGKGTDHHIGKPAILACPEDPRAGQEKREPKRAGEVTENAKRKVDAASSA